MQAANNEVKRLADKHRDTVERQKQCELESRLTHAKLERAGGKLNTVTSDLERQGELQGHKRQVDDLGHNIENVRDDITKQQRDIDAHNEEKQKNLSALDRKKEEERGQINAVEQLKSTHWHKTIQDCFDFYIS